MGFRTKLNIALRDRYLVYIVLCLRSPARLSPRASRTRSRRSSACSVRSSCCVDVCARPKQSIATNYVTTNTKANQIHPPHPGTTALQDSLLLYFLLSASFIEVLQSVVKSVLPKVGIWFVMCRKRSSRVCVAQL